MAFEAVAYTSDGKDFISSPEWTWEFGDDEKSAKNPTEHAYAKEGVYTVTVTATAKEGTGTAETAVEVVGDGGGDALLGGTLYLRDPFTKAVIPPDGVCEVVQVVMETTDMVLSGPVLWKQTPPDGSNWVNLGGGTAEYTGNPNLRRWYWSWLTYERNWPVSFKATYMKPGTPPPYPPPGQQVTVGPATWVPNNTAVHSGDGVLVWDGTNALTIPWMTTHTTINNPRFTIAVCIYAIDGASPVKTITLTNQPLGQGSTQWSGQTDLGQPPGSQIAQPGIYTYRVTATHGTPPNYCTDVDKSYQLTPIVRDFRYWLLPTADPHVATMTGYVKYELNRTVSAAYIDIYGRGPTGVYPVLLQSNVACPHLEAGVHLANAFSFPVGVDGNGNLLGTYHAVIHANETFIDGLMNRDMLPKFAMQRSHAHVGVALDLGVEGRDETTEESPGGYLGVNLGDDDVDGNEDRTQTAPPSGIGCEDDLLGLTIALPDEGVDVGVVTLTATAGGSRIGGCVWLSPVKAPVGGVHTWALGAPATTWDLSVPNRPSQTQLWLEGLTHSGAPRDITLELSFTAAGAAPLVDRVDLTVFEVTALTPSGTDAIRAMVSTLHDDVYPSSSQTEDGKVRLAATITPVEEGVPVWFGTFDPDDKSSYEPDVNGSDNLHEEMLLGSLSAAPGYTPAPGDPPHDPYGNSILLGVLSDAAGQAQADLRITDHCSGDNYEDCANPCTGPDHGDKKTAPMVAWKRVYLEVDYMYEDSADLAADFIADGNGDDDVLAVATTTPFDVGNSVIVFDADHPSGETRQVISKTSTTLTVADLANGYDAGYPRTSGRGAAVVKAGTGVLDGLFAGSGSLVEMAYGAQADGTDGGCFVEFVALPAGSGNVPYMAPLAGRTNDFSDVWFADAGKANYFHCVGATYCEAANDDTMGITGSYANWSYTFVERLRDMFGGAAPLAAADTSAHELGHQFDIDPTDSAHAGVPAHEPPDDCVMSYTAGSTDGIAEFCADIPATPEADDGCIYDVRTASDGR